MLKSCQKSFKCHCLRKCSRGQKLWSTDLAETWRRSWVQWDNYFKGQFGSLLWLLVLDFQGGLIFCPLSTKNPAFQGTSQMNLTMDCTIIELSFHACNFVLKVLHREEPEARVWPKFMLKLQPKIAIFQNFSIFACLPDKKYELRYFNCVFLVHFFR